MKRLLQQSHLFLFLPHFQTIAFIPQPAGAFTCTTRSYGYYSRYIPDTPLFTGSHSNQNPRCRQKPTYTPIFSHHVRSRLLCTPVNSTFPILDPDPCHYLPPRIICTYTPNRFLRGARNHACQINSFLGREVQYVYIN